MLFAEHSSRGAWFIVVLLVMPPFLDAQDSVTVSADPSLGRGGFRRALLGDHYRDLWTVPVRVAKLDLAREYGGLTPLRKGGGLQTRSLRFKGGDGKEYVFRALQKDPTRVLPGELRETFAADILRDQMSAMHPGGALVVPPILQAAGVLHTAPRLVVMPDDARLGEFRAEFAGHLGTLEERPTTGDEEVPAFADAKKLIDTPELLRALREKPWVKVDARAFLTARLLDLYLGDWDRHEDQWRWALVDDGDGREHYLPIPRDRDQAFARYDGLFLGLARQTFPQLLNFGPEYAEPIAMTWNGRNLDRRLLVELDWEAWDDAATSIQSALTDSVIDAAIARLPAEYRTRDGERMRDAMIARRQGLREAAHRTYRFLAKQVRLQAGDKDDVALVERLTDGSTDVALARRSGERYFHRSFDPKETAEVQLDLRGGDDRLVIRGDGSGPMLRVVGGSGADTLLDSSRTRHSRFYDTGKGTVSAGRGVDHRAYVQPADTNVLKLPERDWGHRELGMPLVSASSDLGFTLGYNWADEGFGFRRQPYANRVGVGLVWSFGRSAGRAAVNTAFKLTNKPTYVTLDGLASGIEHLQFYGFGNGTLDTGDKSLYNVHHSAFALGVGLGWGLESRSKLRVGLRARHSVTDPEDQNPLSPIATQNPLGTGTFGQAGFGANWVWDSRDLPQLPTKGVRVVLDGAYYPITWRDAEGAFGTLDGAAAAFLSPGKQEWFTLVFRGGGHYATGDYPYFEAAYLGGIRSLRGFARNRFAGQSSLYGSTEARVRLFRTFIVLPGELGVFGLADIGRVYTDQDENDDWHSDAGGGLYYGIVRRSLVVAAGVATGKDGSRFYFGIGLGQ